MGDRCTWNACGSLYLFNDMKTSSLSLGPQHSGGDGDGRHGPRDQHERNHHAGGCPEQDGEVWGKPDPARPVLYVWPDSASVLWEASYAVCRHVCMLHPACYSQVTLWMLPTYSWVFVLFFSASPLAAALLSPDTGPQHILSCIPQYKSTVS